MSHLAPGTYPIACPSCGENVMLSFDGYDCRGEGWTFLREPKCEACGVRLVLTEDRLGEPDLSEEETSSEDTTRHGGESPSYRESLRGAGRGHLIR